MWPGRSNLVHHILLTGDVWLLRKYYALSGSASNDQRTRRTGSPTLRGALDLGAQADKVLHEPRITAVDVEDVVNLGVTVGNQPGQH